MEESVTSPLPALLDRRTAKGHLAVLGSRDSSKRARWPTVVYATDREWGEGLLELVNDKQAAAPGGPVSAERQAALRAFLEERVAIRERAALLRNQFAQDSARHGTIATKPPLRTVALSMAADALPPLLNEYRDASGKIVVPVRKRMVFANAGAARSVRVINPKKRVWVPVTQKGRKWKEPRELPEDVNLTLEGAGGELARSERVECDSNETGFNYALALMLDRAGNLGTALCRCHADGCGHLWLVDEQLTSKPTRNFCVKHAKEKKRLGDVERKRRQRAREDQ